VFDNRVIKTFLWCASTQHTKQTHSVHKIRVEATISSQPGLHWWNGKVTGWFIMLSYFAGDMLFWLMSVVSESSNTGYFL